MKAATTWESRSKGGKAASLALVAWQRMNVAFKARCSELGKATGPKLMIPHQCFGSLYPSKKALQAATGMSNCGFYGKLARGEIERVQKS